MADRPFDYASPSHPELRWWNDRRQNWRLLLLVIALCGMVAVLIGVVSVFALFRRFLLALVPLL